MQRRALGPLVALFAAATVAASWFGATSERARGAGSLWMWVAPGAPAASVLETRESSFERAGLPAGVRPPVRGGAGGCSSGADGTVPLAALPILLLTFVLRKRRR
jgi:MYXO-CTERM domain-containing protein